MTSTSPSAAMACSTMYLLSAPRPAWMPGVSTNTICAFLSGTFLMPVIRLRVVCGLGVTIASFSPTSWLSSVDLPTFGRPTMAQKPARLCRIASLVYHGVRSAAMTAVATSFSKSLFFGLLPEEMVFPYPQPPTSERENLRLILESVHKFAAEKIDAKKIDEDAHTPEPVLTELKSLGLFGLSIPEAFGGVGLSTTGYARVMQEMAGIDASIAVTLGGHQSIGCKGIV